MTVIKKRRLAEKAQESVGVSQRVLARKFHISAPYVNKILRKSGIYCFKREKVPLVSETQLVNQRLRVGRLYREVLSIGDGNPHFVMDDESYFTLRGSDMHQNDQYYATCKYAAEPSIRYACTAKFEQRLMMWIAISQNGISRPFFCPAGGALNGEIYRKECIQKRLMPFLQKYHADNHYLFWPDLASYHYASVTQKLFQESGIKLGLKEKNPPNCPQLRPVEDFWGILKQAVYSGGWEAENHDQLKRRILYRLHRINKTMLYNMMKNVKSKLSQARDNGVNYLLH